MSDIMMTAEWALAICLVLRLDNNTAKGQYCGWMMVIRAACGERNVEMVGVPKRCHDGRAGTIVAEKARVDHEVHNDLVLS